MLPFAQSELGLNAFFFYLLLFCYRMRLIYLFVSQKEACSYLWARG